MNLKTSFFNTTILKSNIKRFWWISAVFFILFLSVAILPLINYGGMRNPSVEPFMVLNIFSMCACALMPSILFSYLNSSGAVTCTHAFPIKRRALYITNILSIYLIFFVPTLLGYLFSWLYTGINYPEITGTLTTYFLMSIILNTVTVSGATLGVMVTGNTIASIAFAGLFIFFPFYTEAIIKGFLDMNVFGIWSSDYFFIENFNVQSTTPFMLGYFASGIIILVLCWLLYKYRKLETNGDIISYNFLKPIFISCVSVFFGLLGYYYLSAIYDMNSIFLMLPFGILGIVISHMLSKKAFTLKGIHIPVILYVIFVTVVFSVINYDLTGYEKRIPSIDDIKSVNICKRQLNDQYDDQLLHYENEEYRYKEKITSDMFEITDKKDIENVIKLHEHLISTKENPKRNLGELTPIVYTLNNGRKIKRTYRISYENDLEYLKPIWETEQLKREEWKILLPLERTISSVNVSDMRLGINETSFAEYDGDSDSAKKLYEALKKDLINAKFEDVFCNRDGVTRIQIVTTRPLENVETKEILPPEEVLKSYMRDSMTVVVSPEFTNTIEALTSLGLYDKVAKAEDIKSVNLQINEKNEFLNITDRETINELYEFSKSYLYTDYKNNFPERIYSVMLDFRNQSTNTVYSVSIPESCVSKIPDVIIDAANKYSEDNIKTSDIEDLYPAVTTKEIID